MTITQDLWVDDALEAWRGARERYKKAVEVASTTERDYRHAVDERKIAESLLASARTKLLEAHLKAEEQRSKMVQP